MRQSVARQVAAPATNRAASQRLLRLSAHDHPETPTLRCRQVRRRRVHEVRQICLAASVRMAFFDPQTGRRYRLQDVYHRRVGAESFREHREAVPPYPRAIAASEPDDDVWKVAQAEGPVHANRMGT